MKNKHRSEKMTSDKYIKFTKEKLEKLPYNSGWWFASNMESLCIRCGKKKKTYQQSIRMVIPAAKASEKR